MSGYADGNLLGLGLLALGQRDQEQPVPVVRVDLRGINLRGQLDGPDESAGRPFVSVVRLGRDLLVVPHPLAAGRYRVNAPVNEQEENQGRNECSNSDHEFPVPVQLEYRTNVRDSGNFNTMKHSSQWEEKAPVGCRV